MSVALFIYCCSFLFNCHFPGEVLMCELIMSSLHRLQNVSLHGEFIISLNIRALWHDVFPTGVAGLTLMHS